MSATPDTATPARSGTTSVVRMQARAPIDGRFSLLDHHGKRVTERSWGERHLLVFFGFTHCAIVCPRELGKLRQVLALLAERASEVQVLYVTVDPLRDDPPTMRDYLAAIDTRFVGLTGTPVEIDHAMKAFRVFATRREDPSAPDGYVMPHTAFTFLMAPGRGYLTHFTDTASAEAIAERVTRALGQGVER